MRATLSPAFTRSEMRNMLEFVADCEDQMAEFYINEMRKPENKSYLTIVTDRCPNKKQNLNYAMYHLTAVYHWESEKTRSDMEVYVWNEEPSKKTVANWSQWSAENPTAVAVEAFLAKFTADIVHGGKGYVAAIEGVMNVGQNEYQLAVYKEAVLKMFVLKKTEPDMGLDDQNKA